jgi:glutamate racemase
VDKCAENCKPIAFLDSGVGGISVLAAAVSLLPLESYVYYGDTAHAPYGGRSADEVRAFSARVAGELYGLGCKALVVACNTATSAAINLLREMLPIPVIGMEPAIKPAMERNNGGKVLVMATPLTLKEEKFRSLCNVCGANSDNVTVLPCPGLVELVEQGQVSGPEVHGVLTELFNCVDLSRISTVVLGCTHYLFLRQELATMLHPQAEFVDGNSGTVKQLQRVLDKQGLLLTKKVSADGSVEFLSSAGAEAVRLYQELYKYALQYLPIDC